MASVAPVLGFFCCWFTVIRGKLKEDLGFAGGQGVAFKKSQMDFLEPEIDEPKPKTKVNASVVETTREEKEKIKAEKKIKKSIFESGDISSYSQAELSALFQKHTKKAFPSLSEIELKDLSLPGTISYMIRLYL